MDLPAAQAAPVRADGMLSTTDVALTCTDDPAADADNYCTSRTTTTTQTPPTAAACLSCHDLPESAAHAQVNTTSGGVESCAVCHRAGAAYGLDKVHALEP